jgi:hypothetical protein
MVRSMLAVVLGAIAALATLLLLQSLGMMLFPLPPGTPLDTEEDLARIVAAAGTGERLWSLLCWLLAALAAGVVAARTSHRHRLGAALCAGALVACGVALDTALLPRPAWLAVAGILLPFPAAWLGARLARPRSPAAAGSQGG